MKEGIWALIAFAVAWLIAQVAKVVIQIVSERGEWNCAKVVETLMASGGMPSSHTASLTALAMYIGLALGFDSVAFAISTAVAIIVAYDAVNVRYAVGEQGKMIKNLVHRKMRIVEGHTVRQMVAGLLIGIMVGAAVFLVNFAVK